MIYLYRQEERIGDLMKKVESNLARNGLFKSTYRWILSKKNKKEIKNLLTINSIYDILIM